MSMDHLIDTGSRDKNVLEKYYLNLIFLYYILKSSKNINFQLGFFIG